MRDERERGVLPRISTVTKAEDGWRTIVSMTEEELFRKVLGDAEFVRRRTDARAKDIAYRVEHENKPPEWHGFWK